MQKSNKLMTQMMYQQLLKMFDVIVAEDMLLTLGVTNALHTEKATI